MTQPLMADTPLDEIDEAHVRKLALCDLLEGIADDLPNPDRANCMRAAAQITIELPIHHADEDLGLFPILRGCCRPEDRVEPLLARLEDEHLDDEATMEEIVTLLRRYAAGEASDSDADAAGYALRGFFEGQRRHLALEDVMVMPLARMRLNRADLKRLKHQMEQNRQGLRPSALRRAGATRQLRSVRG